MIYMLMGVSGSGKTTIGKRLSEKLGWQFYDGDDFHPAENLEKMSKGISLTDRDRQPWLEKLHDLMQHLHQKPENAIIACSALKEDYREYLADNLVEIQWIYLKGNYQQIASRIEQRQGHFMKTQLLASQFQALEEPNKEETLVIDITLPPEQIIEHIISRSG